MQNRRRSGGLDRDRDQGPLVAHACAILAAIAGVVRAGLGQALLKLYMRRHRRLTGRDQFDLGWDFIRRFRWLFRGREHSGNRFQAAWQNIAFVKLLILINARENTVTPPIIIHGQTALTDAAGADGPVIVVTIHTRLVGALTKVFEDLKIPFAVIVSAGNQRGPRLVYGVNQPQDQILTGRDTLLVARKKMTAGQLIYGCVDFTARVRGTLYHHNYVAEGLFAFARKTNATLVYAITNVNAGGVLQTTFARPQIAVPDASAAQLAEDFVRFVKTQPATPNDLQIRNPATVQWPDIKPLNDLWVRR